MKVPQGYLSGIPSEYKKEFLTVTCKENLLKMLVAAALLAVVELIVAVFLVPPKSASFFLALWIALLVLFFIPILYYFRSNIEQISKYVIMLVQTAFLVAILMLYEAKKKGKNRVEVQINKEKKSAAIN